MKAESPLSNRIAGWSVFALCVLFPVFLIFLYPSPQRVIALVFVVVFAVAVAEGSGTRLLRDLWSGLPLYAFFALAFLSAFWSYYPEFSFNKSWYHLPYPALTALALVALRGDNKRWLYATCVALPLVCFSLYVYVLAEYGTIRAASPEQARLFGSISDLYPALCMLCVPFLVLLWLRGRWGWALAGFVPAVAVVALSQSRGAALALGLCVVLCGVLFRERWRIRAALALKTGGAALAFVALAVAVFGYALTVGGLVGRLDATTDFVPGSGPAEVAGAVEWCGLSSAEVPDSARALQYEEGASMVLAHPLRGLGYEALEPHISACYPGIYAPVGYHNLVLSAWGGMGILGLAALGWIAFSATRGFWRRRRDPFVAAAFASFLVAGFHGQLRPELSTVTLYVVLAVLLATNQSPTYKGALSGREILRRHSQHGRDAP